jgi:hypothetical protein
MSVQPSGSNVGGASVNDGPSDNTVHSQYKILTLTFNQDCT